MQIQLAPNGELLASQASEEEQRRGAILEKDVTNAPSPEMFIHCAEIYKDNVGYTMQSNLKVIR